MFQLHYIQLAGQGDLQAHLQSLKAKLRDEGLFDPDRKLPLPTYPEHIALITADHSAALSDFLSIAQTHFPHVHLTLVPAIMQGDDAPRSILQALEKTS